MSTGQILAIIGSAIVIALGIYSVKRILDEAPIEDDLPKDEERE